MVHIVNYIASHSSVTPDHPAGTVDLYLTSLHSRSIDSRRSCF